MRPAQALALTPLALLLAQQQAQAEAPPEQPRKLSWEEHQKWQSRKLVPVVAPEMSVERTAPEQTGLASVKQKPANIQLKPVDISQGKPVGKPELNVQPTSEVLPFEAIAPATKADILINYNVPEIRDSTDDFAQTSIEVAVLRSVELQAKVIEGNAVIGNAELRQISLGQPASFRVVLTEGRSTIGLYNSQNELIETVPIHVRRSRAYRHSVNINANRSEALDGESEARDNYSAGYSISPRSGSWNLSVRAGYAPSANGTDANRSVGVSFSKRWD
jgi:hypothetical protein